MDAIPTNLHPRSLSKVCPSSIASLSFSSPRRRGHLPAYLQLCDNGIVMALSGSKRFHFCSPEYVSMTTFRGGFPSKKQMVQQHINKMLKVPRCEMAADGQVSQVFNAYRGRVTTSFSDSMFGDRVRALCFYLTTYICALPLFFAMLLAQPFVLIVDKHKRKVQHVINGIWASLTTFLFYKAEIEGLENLPGPDEAAVYIANHQSFLDVYTLLLLERPFKIISKTSNFMIPIIGWAMYLTGHVPLHRMDMRSQMECLRHSEKLIRQGVPFFFFPEGTCSRDGKMAQFKRGAFAIAAKANVPIIPISLIGTGNLMPKGSEDTLRAGSVKVIIHPPIQGSNVDELCKKSRDVIEKSLLQHGLGIL